MHPARARTFPVLEPLSCGNGPRSRPSLGSAQAAPGMVAPGAPDQCTTEVEGRAGWHRWMTREIRGRPRQERILQPDPID